MQMTGSQDRKYQSPQPVTSAPPPLLILADDLTGACDTAVAFTRAYDSIRIQINAIPEVACFQALSTESRDLPVSEAEGRIRNIVERLPPNTSLFKKIDSVFRGNTIAEVAATLGHADYDLGVFAPAHPALGRTVRDGVLHVSDTCGQRTLPIAELLANEACSLTSLPVTRSADELAVFLRSCLNNPTPAVLCDATCQDDLARIVIAARSLGKRILWIGSGGLAQALAAELPPLKSNPSLHPRPGQTVFFIGSPHPVTRMQVEHLQRCVCTGEQGLTSIPSSTTDLLIPVMLDQTTSDDILRSVAAHDPTHIGCLFMTGGDTAHFVCRALGIHALRLEREFAPGVPLAVAEGGPFDGIPVVLKSGGFGEPDLLCRLLETCRAEVTA
jgi:D-threonate/D-erythronate kinase